MFFDRNGKRYIISENGMQEIDLSSPTDDNLKARELRLVRILRKHTTAADVNLSDRDFIEAVVDRFRKYNDHYLVDVNE